MLHPPSLDAKPCLACTQDQPPRRLTSQESVPSVVTALHRRKLICSSLSHKKAHYLCSHALCMDIPRNLCALGERGAGDSTLPASATGAARSTPEPAQELRQRVEAREERRGRPPVEGRLGEVAARVDDEARAGCADGDRVDPQREHAACHREPAGGHAKPSGWWVADERVHITCTIALTGTEQIHIARHCDPERVGVGHPG